MRYYSLLLLACGGLNGFKTNVVENERLRERVSKLQSQYSNAQVDITSLEKTKQQLQDELTKIRRYTSRALFIVCWFLPLSRTLITSNYEREAVFTDRKDMQQKISDLEKMVEDQQLGLHHHPFPFY